MANFFVTAVIVLILGSVIWFIRREKKRGVKCIGCPDAATCSGGCGGNCSGCSGSCANKSNHAD